MGRSRRRYQRIALETHGELPQPCHFCDDYVVEFARSSPGGCVHQRLQSTSQLAPANLVIAHFSCHNAHHHSSFSQSSSRDTSRVMSRTWKEIGREEMSRRIRDGRRKQIQASKQASKQQGSA